MSAVVLIPAFNEAARVAETVTAVRGSRTEIEVLVIDDGSTDDTAGRAEAAGAHVLRMPRNSGKGAALEAGLTRALELWKPDVLAFLDADLGRSASQVETLLAPVETDDADMTIATLPPPARPAGFGLVKGLARLGIQVLGGPFDASAPLSGQRAIRATALPLLLPLGSGYGVEVALTVRALRAGIRIREVPTTMSHAHTGRDLGGFVHRGRQFAHVLGTLGRLAFERQSARR